MRGEDAPASQRGPSFVDHPRMRGEDLRDKWKLPEVGGSPPHARGRHAGQTVKAGQNRITPACAGKTAASSRFLARSEDHPRMRGEDDLYGA